MKFSLALSALLVVLPLVAAVPAPKAAPVAKIISSPGAKVATPTPVVNKAAAKPPVVNNAKANNNGKGAVALAQPGSEGGAAVASGATAATATQAAGGAAASTSSVAAAATSIAAASSASDLQTSLTLDPGQVQPGLAFDGQEVQEAGQVASLTSINNFINFCATQPDLPLTNGQQILTGSCNPTIMGVIVAKSNMPSAKIFNPPNFSTILSNQTINFEINVAQMTTGHFTNADLTFLGAPQQVDANGLIISHSHVTVNQVASLQDPTPADPTKFNFFKGLNDPAVNGVLSAAATGGLPAGVYRACTLNTGANHQPVLVAVAQHASLDDCTYFTVTDDPNAVSSAPSDGTAAGAAAAAGTGSGAAAAASTAAASTDSAAATADSTTAAAAAATTAAANQAKQQPGSTGGAKVAKKPTFSPPQRGGNQSGRFRGGRGRGRF